MELSEDLVRLNALQEKMADLLKSVLKLRAENDRLNNENALLNDEAAGLKEQMGRLEQNTAQYLNERDTIKDRVEYLIQMLEDPNIGLDKDF
jgi:uncharacterized coiled-coil DUF342 family protein